MSEVKYPIGEEVDTFNLIGKKAKVLSTHFQLLSNCYISVQQLFVLPVKGIIFSETGSVFVQRQNDKNSLSKNNAGGK